MTKSNNTVREKIIKGLELSGKKLIQTKKNRNLFLVVSQKGKVIQIDPNKL